MTKSEKEKQVLAHGERNAELLSLLKEKGVTETDQVEADYHFWAFEHEDAVILAKHLYEKGYSVLVISPVSDGEDISWNVEARKFECVRDIVSTENTETLVNLAAKHNSVYDGWGTTV